MKRQFLSGDLMPLYQVFQNSFNKISHRSGGCRGGQQNINRQNTFPGGGGLRRELQNMKGQFPSGGGGSSERLWRRRRWANSPLFAKHVSIFEDVML